MPKLATKTLQANIDDTAILTLPRTADDLKEAFETHKIPLQEDFADLIDMAHAGQLAAGAAAGQNGPGAGLIRQSDDAPLEVKVATTNPGLSVDTDGLKVGAGNGISVTGASVAVKVAATNPGLSVDTDGLKVGAGNGISVTGASVAVGAGDGINVSSAGVAVKVATTNPGLSVDTDGLKVGAGNGISVTGASVAVGAGDGINVSSAGVAVKVATTNPGLSVDTDGLKVGAGNGISVTGASVAVGAGDGINVSSAGVAVKVATTNPGLSVDTDGLKVGAGNGISVTGTTVAVSTEVLSKLVSVEAFENLIESDRARIFNLLFEAQREPGDFEISSAICEEIELSHYKLSVAWTASQYASEYTVSAGLTNETIEETSIVRWSRQNLVGQTVTVTASLNGKEKTKTKTITG
ncbi:hypothetical protein [Mycoavidus sp. SF9855]|uniref:hypothetical protein n=1 Tax=Mycoavidus sp. SF9855 TaxID=2968475 RepID=UPI00211C7142|nr:hypothetical protein [Mycoavidus sp. SF9855]UUM22275.1 hypothetical protein NQD60_04215 [Mycoavidus sp. SF9855]